MSIQDEFPPEEELHLDSVLADAYTRLRDRAVEMERAQQWRPIETAPKDGTVIILAWAHEPTWRVASRWDEDDEMWADEGGGDEDPGGFSQMTHWQPLPPGPEPHQTKPCQTTD